MLQAMEKAGAIERRPDEHDQRLTRVLPHGARATSSRPSCAPCRRRTSTTTIGTLPESDRRELARLLDALATTHLGAIAARRAASRGEPRRGSDGRATSVIGLLKERLRPYWRQILLVIALLFVQAITNLYLPTLNADIINNGVVKGDTALHPGHRRLHARGHARPA